MKVKVLEHEYKRSGLLNYVATVEVEDYNGDIDELVGIVSARVGCHPLGYGVYSRSIQDLRDNKYRINWTTSTTAD